MKSGSIMMAALLLAGTLGWAQVCPPTSPGTVCVVPPQQSRATGTPSTTVTTPMVLGTSSTLTTTGTTGMTTMGACGAVSADTACIVNEIRMLQAQVRATMLDMRAQSLIDRMNRLMADEMAFRMQLAANPNLPGAQTMAMQLQDEASSLNRDIVAFTTELNSIPASQRPYLAASVNTLDTVYWTPALQRFAEYRTQFPTNATVYQTAAAQQPWLTQWQANYQASINNIATTPTTVASVRWWTTTQVLGSTETYPGSSMVLPAGTIVVLPDGTRMTLMSQGTIMTGSTMMPGMSTGTTTMPPTY